jgi:hypothetical protein
VSCNHEFAKLFHGDSPASLSCALSSLVALVSPPPPTTSEAAQHHLHHACVLLQQRSLMDTIYGSVARLGTRVRGQKSLLWHDIMTKLRSLRMARARAHAPPSTTRRKRTAAGTIAAYSSSSSSSSRAGGHHPYGDAHGSGGAGADGPNEEFPDFVLLQDESKHAGVVFEVWVSMLPRDEHHLHEEQPHHDRHHHDQPHHDHQPHHDRHHPDHHSSHHDRHHQDRHHHHHHHHIHHHHQDFQAPRPEEEDDFFQVRTRFFVRERSLFVDCSMMPGGWW